MLGIQEKESISEVLEILDYMDEEYKNKISPDFLKFLQNNKATTYKKHINPNKDIACQISRNKTKALLGVLFYNFWCNEEEKKEFIKNLKENEARMQMKLSETGSYTDLFLKNKEIERDIESLPITVKQTWYRKIINILNKIFRIKREF